MLNQTKLAKVFGMSVMASFVALTCSASFQSAKAEPTAQDLLNNYKKNLGTTQLGIGDKFLQTQVLGKGQTITFEWKTTVTGETSGKWIVTDRPTGNQLATGTATPTGGSGLVGKFTIDFSKVPPPQIQTGLEKIYYVTIQPLNARGVGMAMPSNPVKLIYSTAGNGK